MNVRKILSGASLIFILLLSACGSNNRGEQTQDDAAATPPPATPGVQGKPTPTSNLSTPILPTATKDLPTPTVTFTPPPGFTPYQDQEAGVVIYLPESWVVTNIDSGRFAVLQSYPEDKYIGGEGLLAGDTKCDLNIHQSGITAADLIDQWKSSPTTTIISEQEISLPSGQVGIRIESESRGRALSLVTEVNENTVALTCFGAFEPFDEIAGSLIASDLAPPPAPASPTDEQSVSAVVILAAAGLNLRTGPSLTSEVVGVLPLNEIVPVIGLSSDGDWWQVTCPEGTAGECWITADPRWSAPASLAD